MKRLTREDLEKFLKTTKENIQEYEKLIDMSEITIKAVEAEISKMPAKKK